jgi:hypothetical protein
VSALPPRYVQNDHRNLQALKTHLDFIALENMISGGSEAQEDDTDFEHNRRTSRLHRFSRYLRFARHGHDEDVGEPTRLSIATRPSIGATTTESDTQLVRREI